MLNPHPPLSSFPIVLIVLLIVAELVRLRSSNVVRADGVCRFLIVVFLLVLPLTYFSGYFGADFARRQFDVPDDAIHNHQLWAKCSFLLGALPVLLYFLSQAALGERPALGRKLRVLYGLSLLILGGLLVRTSWLGGELVFTHGAGVQVAPQK